MSHSLVVSRFFIAMVAWGKLLLYCAVSASWNCHELSRIQMPRFEDPSDLDRNQQCSECASRTRIRSSQASPLIGSGRHGIYMFLCSFATILGRAHGCIMVAKVRHWWHSGDLGWWRMGRRFFQSSATPEERSHPGGCKSSFFAKNSFILQMMQGVSSFSPGTSLCFMISWHFLCFAKNIPKKADGAGRYLAPLVLSRWPTRTDEEQNQFTENYHFSTKDHIQWLHSCAFSKAGLWDQMCDDEGTKGHSRKSSSK